MIQLDWDRLTTVRLNRSELFDITIGATNGFNDQKARAFADEHWYFIVQCCITYFFLIFGIKFFMRNREPFDLQRPLNAWNMILAIFSTAGAIAMAPDFFRVLRDKGFRGSYCDTYGMTTGTNGFWMFIFVLSKLAEFTDTFFIVLRKKPLLFLHWYHHILTLMYGFYSYPASPAFNRYLTYLNLVVHSFMYTYYFLRSINVKIPGAVAKAITTSQILQFVISIVVLVFCGIEHYILKSDCEIDIPSFWFASLMDLSYLVLFVNFFLKSYVVKGGKDKYKKVDDGQKKKQ